MFDNVPHSALGLPVAELHDQGAVVMQHVAQLKPPLLLHVSVVGRLPLHHCLPMGLWTPSAGAWRNICQHDTCLTRFMLLPEQEGQINVH